MTTCELILKPITRMVEEENKDLDEIANAVCPKVEYGREKIIRIIKDFIGEEYLIQHAQSLKYDIKKSPSGDLTFDGVQNTYLISPVLGSYASP